jgi:hypothetical protein
MSAADSEEHLSNAEGLERRLLRARVVAALALATATLPVLSAGVQLAREEGVPALAGAGGGWLAVALTLFLPLYFGRAEWPLRCALGNSLWAAIGLAYGLGDLLQSTLLASGTSATWLSAGPSPLALAWVLALLVVPLVAPLLYLWVDAKRGFQLSSLPAGVAVGLILMLAGFMLSGLVLSLGSVAATHAFGRLPKAVDLILLRLVFSAGLAGLLVGVSFGLAKDGSS